MKLAKERQKAPEYTASVLVDAFPWIKTCTGKTIVIKYGGAAMVDEKLRDDVMSDIVMLKIMGVNPVLVHGGGKEINKNFEAWDIPVEFKNGYRVTTEDAMDVVKMTLIGKVNEELVSAMNRHGNLAVGVSGADANTILAEVKDPELGRVGNVVEVNPAYIQSLINADYIPVIASVGVGEDGQAFNINADVVASEVASAIGAHKIIFLTDVDGYYQDFEDKDSLVSQMKLVEVKELLAYGQVSTGMIPKLESCVRALDSGVPRAHIVNGAKPHSILTELLTTSGCGTVIYTTTAQVREEMAPLGLLASRLVENM